MLQKSYYSYLFKLLTFVTKSLNYICLQRNGSPSRDMKVVDEKWQGILPDAANLLPFTRDHQRNVCQWHLVGNQGRIHLRNVRIVAFDGYSRLWPRAYISDFSSNGQTYKRNGRAFMLNTCP